MECFLLLGFVQLASEAISLLRVLIAAVLHEYGYKLLWASF
jgi:hypothetical protein